MELDVAGRRALPLLVVGTVFWTAYLVWQVTRTVIGGDEVRTFSHAMMTVVAAMSGGAFYRDMFESWRSRTPGFFARQFGLAYDRKQITVGAETVTVGTSPFRRDVVLACLRSQKHGDGEILTAVGKDGVLFRARGGAATLDALAAELQPARPTLALNPSWQPLLVAAPMVLALAAVALHFLGLPFASCAMAVIAPFVGALELVRGGKVTVGADGVVVSRAGKERFLGYDSIKLVMIDAPTKSATIHLLDEALRLTFAQAGSADVIKRAHAHYGEAKPPRDEHVAARRRIAVSDEAAPPLYRAHLESPSELADALLDTSESRSVRLRAARKLGEETSDEAEPLRRDVEARLVDPDVHAELRRR